MDLSSQKSSGPIQETSWLLGFRYNTVKSRRSTASTKQTPLFVSVSGFALLWTVSAQQAQFSVSVPISALLSTVTTQQASLPVPVPSLLFLFLFLFLFGTVLDCLCSSCPTPCPAYHIRWWVIFLYTRIRPL